MNKAFLFRIHPTKAQEILIKKTFGCVRFIYNQMLSDRDNCYEATGEYIQNTPASYKKKYVWLKEVDSLALTNAQLHLDTAYRNFFRDPKFGFPQFKSRKDNNLSYTTNLVNGNIRFEEGFLVLPKLKRVKIRCHRRIPEGWKLKSVTIRKKPSGKYFASLLYEYESEVKKVEAKTFLGLDYAMNGLYVDSEGNEAGYPRYYRRMLERLKREQRKLSACEKGSANREKQRIKVAKLHEKVTNQRNDFQHKLSRQIANAVDAVCVEDLNMRGMSQALKFGKSVADNGYGAFLRMLSYKLEEQGKYLVKVSKWYPSSKTCSCCGAIKEHLGLGERIYQCECCGLEMDRDYNASINIREEGKRILFA